MSLDEPTETAELIEPEEPIELHKPALITLFQTCWDYLKFYQDLLVKTLLGYTAITGAVLAFWITHPNFKAAIWGLILPIVLGLALSAFCFFALYKNWPKINDECMDLLLKDLGLEDYKGPSSESYIFILWLVGIISVGSSLACGIVLCLFH